MNGTIRKCNSDDSLVLRDFAERTFIDTFGPLNTPENMAAYAQAAFDPQRIAAELANPASEFYFLLDGSDLLGYVKLNEPGAQTDLNTPGMLEIERIYVRPESQGQGLGKVLIQFCIEQARQRRKKAVWLGVWEKNIKAIGFYQAMGFHKVGTHAFDMGDDHQTDFIMQLELTNE